MTVASDKTHIWVRTEHKAHEKRVALVPADAKKLLDAGYRISVERNPLRSIATEDYLAVGCDIVDEGSWPDAPEDAFILGVKELPEGESDLTHRHIYFGHVYKDQPGWQHTLGRFVSGKGTLYDLECLVDETGRRVAAFGYWAGFAGAAAAVKVWCGQKAGNKPALDKLGDYPNVDALLSELNSELSAFEEKPNMIVIGALGRSGSGAVDLGERLKLDVTRWDMNETKSGGPFPEIQQHSIFVNCILANKNCPRFVTHDDITINNRKLSVISDVSCDPESVYNPIPVYNKSTTFDNPIVSVIDGNNPLDVTAIDHLPSMLPREASEDYSSQLVKALLELDQPEKGIWGRALDEFNKNIARL
ncbi:saccharopine dehydrogenase [Sneathiella glossodoripedis]|uniref:saccharopine dehydrogenase n=1 Tax=Sneathiella glossodoripedis TaxID=418853 RepID=UPI0004711659|nr:saccharopine dehydrogenase [Sneathiella glossodoripedis]